MKKLFPLLLLLSSCAGSVVGPRDTTSQNVHILREPLAMQHVRMSDVETVIDETILQFSIATGHRFEDVEAAVKKGNLWIRFTDLAIDCDATYKRNDGTLVKASKCAGVYQYTGYPPFIEVFYDTGVDRYCLPMTSLSHELVHFLAHKLDKQIDYYHENPLYYGPGSATTEAKVQSAELLCPWLMANLP